MLNIIDWEEAGIGTVRLATGGYSLQLQQMANDRLIFRDLNHKHLCLLEL